MSEHLRLLGDQIRASRIAAELTQRELGDRAGIVGKYVSEIERGTRDIPFSTLAAIVERGLQRQLVVSFQHQGTIRVPSYLEDLALAIGALSEEPRARVISVVRTVLELTR